MSVDFTKIFRKNMISKSGLTEAMEFSGDPKQNWGESDFAYRQRCRRLESDKRRAAWEADKTPEQIKQIHADERAAREKKIADDKAFYDDAHAKARAFDVEFRKKQQERRDAFDKRGAEFRAAKAQSETEALEESSETGSFDFSKEDIELIAKALRDISDLQPDGWDDHELSEIPPLLDKLTGEVAESVEEVNEAEEEQNPDETVDKASKLFDAISKTYNIPREKFNMDSENEELFWDIINDIAKIK